MTAINPPLPPFYDKQPSSAAGDSVFIGSKAPDQHQEDIEQGQARLGGFWRRPQYDAAYVQAARVLIEHGQVSGTLDEIALPALFLQRHALELRLKVLLEMAFDIGKLKCDKGPSDPEFELLRSKHSIQELLKQLGCSCAEFGLPVPPHQLVDFCDALAAVETDDFMARYPQTWKKKRATYRFVDEVIIPVAELQAQLEEALSATSYLHDGEGDAPYGEVLHAIWHTYFSHAEHEAATSDGMPPDH